MTASAEEGLPFAGTFWMALWKSGFESMLRMLSLCSWVGSAAEKGRKVVPGIRSMAAL
jgi:hypothetical protein